MIIKHVLEILGLLGSAPTSIILVDHYKKSHMKAKNINKWHPNNLDETVHYKKKEMQKLSNLLSYMKKCGLVENSRDKNSSTWSITSCGRERLELIKSRGIGEDPFIVQNQIKKDDLKVIVFDVPESEKRKRDWLRKSLENLDFKMLQRSVWVGNTKLPEEFIASLSNLQILSCLHIFLVKEKGTIENNFSSSKI